MERLAAEMVAILIAYLSLLFFDVEATITNRFVLISLAWAMMRTFDMMIYLILDDETEKFPLLKLMIVALKKIFE